MNFSISTLRDQPNFSGIMADRIWKAWWRHKGYSRESIEARVVENLTSQPLPFALVAHRGDQFLGTASVIINDLTERPNYAPWVAAVWVEPANRSQGVGSALVRAAAIAAYKRGFDPIYLCARPARTSFYEMLGWFKIEQDVAGVDVFVLHPHQQ